MAGKHIDRIVSFTKSLSGNVFNHQVGVFLIFLAISTALWFVTSLNDEVQRQIDCHIRVVNVPDSVTFISEPPETVIAGVRGRGTHFIRQLLGSNPTVEIDFRHFSKNGRFAVSKSSLLDLIQTGLGDDRQIQDLYPDTIGVFYTSLPPETLPVKVDVGVSTSPNVSLDGPVVSLTDSVKVYGISSSLGKLRFVTTANVHFYDISANCVRRVPVSVPLGCRAVPDSVDVRIRVEPYVTETRMLDVEAVNLPEGCQVIFSPEKVRTSFRVPQSKRKNLPEVRVLADCAAILTDTLSNSVPISADPWYSYIFLDADSVNFLFKNSAAE